MTSSKALSEEVFHNAAGDCLTLSGVVREARLYIAAHPESSYEIVIGSDSHASQSGNATFVAAITVRRIGNGGVHFWMRSQERFFNLKDRIWKEAIMSITLAQELRTLLRERIGEELFWEGRVEFKCIHLDVGEDGPTRELIDSISGMVKGYGFIPVIKPYSYGAFVVADRHT